MEVGPNSFVQRFNRHKKVTPHNPRVTCITREKVVLSIMKILRFSRGTAVTVFRYPCQSNSRELQFANFFSTE
jgi:hypothetical protein